MSETTATTKIVIVSGQEFSVPIETDNEAIREHLKGSGFPDVAAATIQAGKKMIGEVEHVTIEFVKKAGTKGLDGAELAAILQGVPAEQINLSRLPASAAALLARLVEGELTIGEALANQDSLNQGLNDATGQQPCQSEGAMLCARIDHVGAVPCTTPSAW